MHLPKQNTKILISSNPIDTHSHELKIKLSSNRKSNLLTIKNYQLELPRFYSSDDKNNNKNIIFLKDHSAKEDEKNKCIKVAGSKKKQSFQYSKTQKNQTPTKIKLLSLKKIKFVSQKTPQIQKLTNRNSEMANSTSEQETNQGLKVKKEAKDQKSINKNGNRQSSSSHNKIRFKLIQNKTQVEQSISRKNIGKLIQEQNGMNIQIEMDVKKMQKDTPTKVSDKVKKNEKIQINHELFNQYLKQAAIQTPMFQHSKSKTLSNFDQVNSKMYRLSQIDLEKIKFTFEMIRKVLKNSSNLEYTQAYIVKDKNKHQKAINNILGQKFKRGYKTMILLTRFGFYLHAYLILHNINPKSILNVFSKLLDNYIIILNVLDVDILNKKQKSLSQAKVTYKSKQKNKKQNFELIVENRKNIFDKNNQIVKNLIIAFLSSKQFLYKDLFLSLIDGFQQIQSLEYIDFVDKTLKWEILKMPSYPFLPKPQKYHETFLILDLDQTLIHFNSEEQTFHIRPFAEQFIKKIKFHYEVTIFTAATKQYADEILNQIDPQNSISHRLYRNHLTFLNGQAIKDISLLGRNIKNTIIVDNLSENFRMHPDNGILIKSWYGTDEDDILAKLFNLLVKIKNEFSNDLREGIKYYFNQIKSQISSNSSKSNNYRIKYQI